MNIHEYNKLYCIEFFPSSQEALEFKAGKEYYLLTETFDRGLSDLRAKNGEALLVTFPQRTSSNRYCLEVIKSLMTKYKLTIKELKKGKLAFLKSGEYPRLLRELNRRQKREFTTRATACKRSETTVNLG